jgi:hemolysin
MTGNTNSSTKKESNSNVTTEKQKTNNTGTEKVVEDTTTVKTVGSNNKNGSASKNSQNTANSSKNVTSYSGDKIAGYNTADVKTMSVKDFRKLGEKLEGTGHNGKARFLKGTDKEAREMFYGRVVNVAENMSNEKGTVLKGVDKYGNKVVYREFSTRGGGYPTIDVYETINGKEKVVTELKFKE